MPDSLVRTTLHATLLAFDEFNADLDSTGCDAPLAVCHQHTLAILATLSASFGALIARRAAQHALAISDEEHEGLTILLAHIAQIHESADSSGCDCPYTVVSIGSFAIVVALRERIGGWLARWERENNATKASLRAALERQTVALDDWLNTYAPEFCNKGRVREADVRIHAHGGTLAYIADVQEQARAALGHNHR